MKPPRSESQFLSTQNVAHSSDAVPAVSIRLKNDVVLAVPFRFAVVLCKEVHEILSSFNSDIKYYAVWLIVEVVESNNGVIAPVIPHPEDARISSIENLPRSPSELRALFPHTDNSLRPVEHRLGIASLTSNINPLIAPDFIFDDGEHRFLSGGKAGLRLIRPLHRRANRIPLIET